MNEFTADQPRPGDCVLHCGHLDRRQDWWRLDGSEFTRPDGTKGKADWMLQCVKCSPRVFKGGTPNIAGEFEWPADSVDERGNPASTPLIKFNVPPQ